MSSSARTGKHSDPVWKLKWVDRGLEQEELLVSISTDGRVTQWSTAKVSLPAPLLDTGGLSLCNLPLDVGVKLAACVNAAQRLQMPCRELRWQRGGDPSLSNTESA